MKTVILNCILAMIVSASVFAGGKDKLTLKEKIDQAKEVKVYFNIVDIHHVPHTATVGQTQGTGCAKFEEITALPEEYTSSSEKIIKLLNEGFKTTTFVKGDMKSVPIKNTINGIDIPDWLKHGEQLVASVMLSGSYEVNNNGLMGETDLSNSLTITAHLQFFEIVDGKLKVIINKNLASVISEKKKTKECNKYDYFVENFPANSLVEKFNASVDKKLTGFTAKRMQKYEKAMKKKKK